VLSKAGIGQIFVFLQQRFENYKSGGNFLLAFFHGTSYVLILTNNGLGYSLGDFFTKSIAHPEFKA
jgi:hypothetical protein